MDEVTWFLLVGALSWGAWLGGARLGGVSVQHARSVLAVAGSMLVIWTWLMKRPAVAAEVMPVWLLSHIEGIGALPWFVLLLGAAWSRAQRPRQRVLIGWALLLGLMVFVNGGSWMLQSTPSAVMGAQRGQRTVLQTQDYTCVPAAAATLLNRSGYRTHEAEMAELTRTRPGVGSTSIRAVDGINRFLSQGGSPRRAGLVEVELDAIPPGMLPVMTPMIPDPGRRHMVVIVQIDPRFVKVMDPMEGELLLERSDFEERYVGHVIALQ